MGTYNLDIPTDIAVDDKGNVHVTGFTNGFDSITTDFVTIKYDADGGTGRVRYYTASPHSPDRAVALEVDTGGYVYVTGYAARGGTSIIMPL